MKRHCPICKKATDSEKEPNFPFCSERCRLTDLGNWASEKYRVSDPGLEQEEDEPSPEQPPPSKPNESKN